MSALRTWAGDVGLALKVWRKCPPIPIIAALIGGISATIILLSPANPPVCVDHPLSRACQRFELAHPRSGWLILVTFLAIAPELYALGFFGFQRWAYAQVASGGVVRGRDYWYGPWSFLGRYLVLGLCALLVSLPFGVAAIALTFTGHPLAVEIVAIVGALIVDFWLTFATPALVFTTRQAGQAISIGWRFLRQNWPADWPYVLVPPLVIAALPRLLPNAFGNRGVAAVVAVAGQLLACLFAGATAFVYMRNAPQPTHPTWVPRGAATAAEVPAGAWVRCPRCLSVIGLDRFSESDEEPATAVAVCPNCAERVPLPSGLHP